MWLLSLIGTGAIFFLDGLQINNNFCQIRFLGWTNVDD